MTGIARGRLVLLIGLCYETLDLAEVGLPCGLSLSCGTAGLMRFSFSATDWWLPPLLRRLLVIGLDAFLLPLAAWLSFWLRLAHPFHPSFIPAGTWLLLAVLLLGLPLCINGAVQGPYPPRGQCSALSPGRS